MTYSNIKLKKSCTKPNVNECTMAPVSRTVIIMVIAADHMCFNLKETKLVAIHFSSPIASPLFQTLCI